ncbi:MAG: NAD-dependent epimerase/dehydratase family protein [Methylobacter sp.]
MSQQQTILLTGATGFLGSHLLEALLAQGHKVVILKRTTSNTWRIKHLLNQVTSYDVDVQHLALAFEQQRIDVVMHTACHYGRNGDPIHKIVESNLMFGLRILDASLKFNTDTFFNTDTLLQKHLNVYTLSKKQFVEWLAQQSDKIQVINLKLEHMYGRKDDTTKFVPWVLSQLRDQVPEIKLTQGEQQRDFIYIADVVSAYLTTLEKAPCLVKFNEFDVGTGKLVTVKSFLEQLKQNYEANIGPTVTKLAFGTLPYREGEMMTVEVNNQSLLDLGWSPQTELKSGIIKILTEYK